MQRLEKKRKDHLAYLPYTDSAITYSSALSVNPDHVLLTGRGAFVSIVLDNATFVRGIFLRHAWSGKILVYVNDEITDCVDLYAPHLRPEAITLLDSGTPISAVIKLVVIGKNEISAADQLVFKGIQVPLPPVATRSQSAAAEPVPTGGADAAFVEVHARQFDKWTAYAATQGDSEEVSRRVQQAYLERLREVYANCRPGSCILDIGVGYLNDITLSGLIIPSRLLYYGLDINADVCNVNRALFQKYGLDPDNIVHVDNTKLPFPDAFFDLVYAGHSIEHSADLRCSFQEIRRVLKPAGVLHFFVPGEWDDAPEHIYTLTEFEWMDIVAQNGLTPLSYRLGKIYNPISPCWDLGIVATRPD